MRICLYSETALPKMGGQEMVVDALAREFLSRGHDVVVLAPHPRLPLRAEDHKLPYTVVRHPRFYSTRYFVSWYRVFLNRLHARKGADILHCHGLYPPGYLAGLTRSNRGIPTVITSHGGDVHEENVRLVKPGLRQRIVSGLAAADALIAISRFTAERMGQLCPTAQLVNIPNGIDLAPFARQVARPEGLNPAITPRGYLLFVGRLKARKGVDVLLQALARLPENVSLPLVIAGPGEERPALEELAAKLGFGERVIYMGAVHHPIKTYLFQNAFATVVPSRIWEAFGLVALESFAGGAPVIASRLPGLEDVVEPGKTGWLVPAEEPGALAATIREACGQPEQTRKFGQVARQVAMQYDWSVIATQHLALYEELVARNSSLLRARAA